MLASKPSNTSSAAESPMESVLTKTCAGICNVASGPGLFGKQKSDTLNE